MKIDNKLKLPKKSLGQNFLKDKNIIKKIIKSIDINNQNIIEVGPGTGVLTEKILLNKPKNLIVIEKDDQLAKNLLEKFNNQKIEVINEDVLNYDFTIFKNYKILSNLPYNISSKFLVKTLKLMPHINEICCMIQSELALKFDYKKGKMNKYKFVSEYFSNYEILFDVSPNVFFPKPKVNSKIVKFKLKKRKINNEVFDSFIRSFFLNRRKKIRSNKLLKKFIHPQEGDKRYEDLNYLDVLTIYKRFNLFFS